MNHGVPDRRPPSADLVRRVSRVVGTVRQGTRPGLRVLLYHAVGTPVRDDTYGMSVSAQEFTAQMRWLREESGCTMVPLGSGVESLVATAAPSLAVTFDDGFLDVLTIAAPVLTAYRIPFTVFVVGGYLEDPPVRHTYLDPPALRELATIPSASIGAHGYTHRPLTRLAPAALDDELQRSRDVLGSHLGTRPLAMSYPHGAVNRRVVAGARAAGFAFGGTSVLGVNGRGTSPLRLRRTEIVSADRVDDFAGKVRGDYDWYSIRQRLYWPVPHD